MACPAGGHAPCGGAGAAPLKNACRVNGRGALSVDLLATRVTLEQPDGSVHEGEGDVTGSCLGKVLDARRACTDRNELEVPLGFLRVLRKLQGRGHPVVGMRR